MILRCIIALWSIRILRMLSWCRRSCDVGGEGIENERENKGKIQGRLMVVFVCIIVCLFDCSIF